jgi:hypothetical protein
MAEKLAASAKLSSDEKASTYDAIASTLREKLPTDVKQFKSYFVALLADKEYSKVLDSIARVDKSFKLVSSFDRVDSRKPRPLRSNFRDRNRPYPSRPPFGPPSPLLPDYNKRN